MSVVPQHQHVVLFLLLLLQSFSALALIQRFGADLMMAARVHCLLLPKQLLLEISET